MSKKTTGNTSAFVHKVVELALRRHRENIELLGSSNLDLSIPALEELNRRTQIISAYLASLSEPVKILLVHLYFFQDRYTPDDVAKILSINTFAFFRLRRDILAGLAEELGWGI